MMKKLYLIFALALIFSCHSSQKPELLPPQNHIITFLHESDYAEYFQHDLPAPFGIAFNANLFHQVRFEIKENEIINDLDELLNLLNPNPLQIMLRLSNADLRDITEKRLDTEIDSLAATLGSYKHAIYLTVGYEVNNPRYMTLPHLYVPAHQHLVERFKKNNVDNVSFVWHIIGMKPRWEEPITLESCYPGNAFVDWVGLSMHNILPHHYPEDTFFEKSIYDEVAAFAAERNRPLMICESSTRSVKTNFDLKGDSLWNDWYTPFFDFIETHNVRAITHIFYSFDDTIILERWRQMMNKEKFILGRKSSHDRHAMKGE